MLEKINQHVSTVLSVALCLFTLAAVNFNLLQPLSALGVFVGMGLVLCFLKYPLHPTLEGNVPLRLVDWVLIVLVVICCGFVVHQTEPVFESMWLEGAISASASQANADQGPQSLGDRKSNNPPLDYLIGYIAVFLVLEATRRSIGWIVPMLSVCMMIYAYFGPYLPEWLLPHSGLAPDDIVSATFLSSQGILGKPASVMLQYVFLFVVFGSFLEMSGATQYIVDLAQKVFGRSQGGPAQVSVISSGLLGSLSGSAVANAVTTGAFTIPLMRSAGFPRHVAGGIEAASASGGALMPPVMGAAAYMMIELVPGQPSFLMIAKAALIPAVLYYFSLMTIVHFYSCRLGTTRVDMESTETGSIWRYEGLILIAALVVLVGLLLPPFVFTPFKAVSGSLMTILVLTAFRPSLNIATAPRVMALGAALLFGVLYWIFFTDPMNEYSTVNTISSKILACMIVGMFGLLVFGLAHPAWRPEVVQAFQKSAKAGISLVAASACVGIVIGLITDTGVAQSLGENIKGVVEDNLLLALVGIMGVALVLGMGVPSVVCYLLMATLMASLLSSLDVIPLAAHLFIFYFGMMSMVTPPVALAGYATASIADAPIMKTSFAAFRFSLVGFTLPYMFIYQPNLLLLPSGDNPLTTFGVTSAVAVACLGIIALAAGIVGYLDVAFMKSSALSWPSRIALFVAAAMLLSPKLTVNSVDYGFWVNVAGSLLMLAVVVGVLLLPKLKPPPITEQEEPKLASDA